MVLVMIIAFDIAEAAAVLYDLIKPGTPSFTPPKYLTTIISILVRSLERICPKIGFPAVEDGSPSSLALHKDLSGLSTYA